MDRARRFQLDVRGAAVRFHDVLDEDDPALQRFPRLLRHDGMAGRAARYGGPRPPRLPHPGLARHRPQTPELAHPYAPAPPLLPCRRRPAPTDDAIPPLLG